MTGKSWGFSLKWFLGAVVLSILVLIFNNCGETASTKSNSDPNSTSNLMVEVKVSEGDGSGRYSPGDTFRLEYNAWMPNKAFLGWQANGTDYGPLREWSLLLAAKSSIIINPLTTVISTSTVLDEFTGVGYGNTQPQFQKK